MKITGYSYASYNQLFFLFSSTKFKSYLIFQIFSFSGITIFKFFRIIYGRVHKHDLSRLIWAY